jgi:hypothetical protein
MDKQMNITAAKVLRVNPIDKSFVVMANGKELTFNAGNLPLPTVGAAYDIEYTNPSGNPNGPFNSINLNSSKSNIY